MEDAIKKLLHAIKDDVAHIESLPMCAQCGLAHRSLRILKRELSDAVRTTLMAMLILDSIVSQTRGKQMGFIETLASIAVRNLVLDLLIEDGHPED